MFCNRFKGSDIASITPSSGAVCRFYNPRFDRWHDHFALQAFQIQALTEIGEATTRILEFNHPDRVLEREVLIRVGHYPTPAAAKRMTP